MGYTLEALWEQEPFRRFFELTAIPRGSGNTAAASEYVARFAAAHSARHADSPPLTSGAAGQRGIFRRGLPIDATRYSFLGFFFLKSSLPLYRRHIF